jgi:hypothetical protein
MISLFLTETEFGRFVTKGCFKQNGKSISNLVLIIIKAHNTDKRDFTI